MSTQRENQRKSRCLTGEDYTGKEERPTEIDLGCRAAQNTLREMARAIDKLSKRLLPVCKSSVPAHPMPKDEEVPNSPLGGELWSIAQQVEKHSRALHDILDRLAL